MQISLNNNDQLIDIENMNIDQCSECINQLLAQSYKLLRDAGFGCIIDAVVDLDQGSYPSIIFYERPDYSGSGHYMAYRN